ncbi:MAG: ATP-binding cassette domain-containing protein, partial [Promethearchaeota archaeon]
IEMSGGEKQRVGIARALANDPRVIIADEPTGDLDSENAKQIIELLLDINNQGTTIVMVTHDESLLTEKMSILSLIDGRIVKQ